MPDVSQIPVSQFIVRYLEQLGVDYIFGMPGAHILPVYDALYDSSVRSVLAKHEQGAAFMAGGLARAEGRIGACITTAGPGATNLVTGIANAYADRLPVVVITGEAPTHIFGRGGLQESSGEGGSIDQVALFAGITRYNRIIERTDYLVQVLNQASKALFSATPGPVVLSIPFNVQRELVDPDLLDLVVTGPPRHRETGRRPGARQVAQMLGESRKPVLVAGYGCIRSGAQERVAHLAQRMNIPVTTSLKGKGILDEDSPLSLGSLGVTSAGYARRYVTAEADLLIFLGASFNERTSYVWNQDLLAAKRVVQIDHNPEQLEKVFRADLAILGDIDEVVGEIVAAVDDAGLPPRDAPDIQAWKVEVGRESNASGTAIFDARFNLVEAFYRRLARDFPRDLSVFDDNIIYAQSFFDVSAANRYYPNSGISSLGHALPAAIGARLARERVTFAILGDGGFQMCAMEIMTAVNYDVPVNVVVFNNGSMGLIRKNQHQQYRQRFIDCDFVNPDLRQLAGAFGVTHHLVDNLDSLDHLFATADLNGTINLIEIPVDRDAYPNYLSRR